MLRDPDRERGDLRANLVLIDDLGSDEVPLRSTVLR